VEECAVQLWNWAVTKNVGNDISTHLKAKRHVACTLLYCCEPERPTEGTLRKQILMASKTGRTWLDCRNPQMADSFLKLAVKSLEILYSQLVSQVDGDDEVHSAKGDVEKEWLRILSYQAESSISQGNNYDAVVYMKRCREMLMRLPEKTSYLSLMCYNFGIEMYKLKKYEESSFWLQSYDIGKMNETYSPGSEQAKILRLLATVYVEWDCQTFKEKALNTVSLANKESASECGLYLKIRILQRCGASEDHIRALNEMLQSAVSLDVCLNTARLLLSDGEILAFEFLRQVCQHFESSPDLDTALVFHIELLLQKNKELLCKQKIEDVITGHYTRKQLTPQALSTLHVLLWDKAAKHFEAQNFSEALQWYNYSLSFFKAGQMDANLAKLQRNRASCFLHLKQLEKAKEAVGEAERCDPDSIFTHFSVYKIAMQENNAEKSQALSAIGCLSKNPVIAEDKLLVPDNASSSLLSLAAQIALENEQHDTAMKALETLCENSKDDTQVLAALCLIRLVLSKIENLDLLLPYLKMLQKLSYQSNVTIEKNTDEANWFRKIWNCALQCEASPDQKRDFFVLSYQLSQLCPPDRTVLMGQKTCLLMATAASLEICRTSPDFTQTEALSQALELIQICSEVWKTLKASSFPMDPTDTLLVLYEFEARAKLNDPKIETVLESLLEQENIEAKVLETIALAMESPAHFPSLCKKALRAALSLHKKQPQIDISRCKCLHSLIKLSLPNGVLEVEARVLEEVWDYYEEALSIIAAAPDDFPEMEILWLLTRAWNTGILLFSLTQYLEAEKWCGLAMSFVCHLRSLRESYQTQMSGLYTEILDRLDKAKKS
uniref:Protein ZIP4 homolog n=1 Tax=Periophthalmus magnuspinnatus TaxID=409849 RepID=A0A3B4AXW2_9GOBI